jgi:hypothetical protein
VVWSACPVITDWGMAPHVNGAYANFLASATEEDVAAIYPTQTHDTTPGRRPDQANLHEHAVPKLNSRRQAERRFPCVACARHAKALRQPADRTSPDMTAPPERVLARACRGRYAGRLTAKGASWLQPDGIP